MVGDKSFLIPLVTSPTAVADSTSIAEGAIVFLLWFVEEEDQVWDEVPKRGEEGRRV